MAARLLLFQQRVQPLETLVPVLLERCGPQRYLPQRSGLQATPASLCLTSTLDETGLLQDLEVLGDCWLADKQGASQFLYGSLALRQAGENIAACYVCHRLERR